MGLTKRKTSNHKRGVMDLILSQTVTGSACVNATDRFEHTSTPLPDCKPVPRCQPVFSTDMNKKCGR